jgi:hypothetical protein
MSNTVGSKLRPARRARSRGSRLAVAGLVALGGLGLSGCIIVDDSRHDDGTVLLDHSQPVYVTIDADATLDLGEGSGPGDGVGFFVEYSTGGGWRMWASCDTNISDVACAFRAHVVGDADIWDVTPVGLGGGDSVELVAANELWFYADTSTEIDAVEFGSTAGANLWLELWLDGEIDPQFIYWTGDGLIHQGAPDSPVVFQPSAP